MFGGLGFCEFPAYRTREIAVRHIPCPADAQTEKPGGSGLSVCIPHRNPFCFCKEFLALPPNKIVKKFLFAPSFRSNDFQLRIRLGHNF
jgi:hypothetical protein